jgi:hypothetical protein
MHQSSYGSRKAGLVTCYFDESGTDDQSPVTVVGGVILDRRGFLAFGKEWKVLLKKHSIPHVHMKAFQRHGELGALTSSQRESIFSDVLRSSININ